MNLRLFILGSFIATVPQFCSADDQAEEKSSRSEGAVGALFYSTEEVEVAQNQCEVKKKKPTCPPKQNRCCPSEEPRQGTYITAFGGANFAGSEEIATARSDLKTGYVVGGDIGYLFSFGLRFEGEVVYRHNSINHNQTLKHFDIEFKQHSTGHFQSLAFMGNILYNIPTHFWIVPYFGGGLGMSYNKYELKTVYSGSVFHSNASKDGFVWQAIGGFSFVLGDFDINLEYRYYKPNVKHYQDHNAIAGLTYHF